MVSSVCPSDRFCSKFAVPVRTSKRLESGLVIRVVRGDFAVELRGFEPLTSAIRRGEWAAAFKD